MSLRFPDNDQIKYQTALSKAESLLSNSKLKVLKFSLSMHVYSPRIEMYAQMAADRGVQCSTSVEIDGELVCSVEALKKALKQIMVCCYFLFMYLIHMLIFINT